jgi:hypothetical protein
LTDSLPQGKVTAREDATQENQRMLNPHKCLCGVDTAQSV